MLVKQPCIICDCKTRIREVEEGYQVICLDNGHTANTFGKTRSEAVKNWNSFNIPVIHTRIRKRFAEIGGQR